MTIATTCLRIRSGSPTPEHKAHHAYTRIPLSRQVLPGSAPRASQPGVDTSGTYLFFFGSTVRAFQRLVRARERRHARDAASILPSANDVVSPLALEVTRRSRRHARQSGGRQRQEAYAALPPCPEKPARKKDAPFGSTSRTGIRILDLPVRAAIVAPPGWNGGSDLY